MDWIWGSLLVFIAALALFFFWDRKNVERQGILLLRKTQRGKEFIKRVGTRFPRFWKVAGTIGVLAGFYYSLQTIYIFLLLLIDSIITAQPVPGVGIALPAPRAVIGMGYIGIPVWYWIIGVAMLVVVHEGLHGIIASSHRIRLKSLGWGLLAVLPLAFVEPDEKQLNKSSAWTQLRVYAAGSFANFCLAFFMLFVVFSVAFAPFIGPVEGAKVNPIIGYPFANSQLSGMTDNYTKEYINIIITDVDGQPVGNLTQLKTILDEKGVSPGQHVSMGVDVYYESTKEHVVLGLNAAQHPENETQGFIGINFQGIPDVTDEIRPEWLSQRGTVFFFRQMVIWIALINLGVGMFNLLPMGPLDGGKMWGIVFRKISKKHHKRMSSVVTWAMFILFLGILIPALASNFI